MGCVAEFARIRVIHKFAETLAVISKRCTGQILNVNGLSKCEYAISWLDYAYLHIAYRWVSAVKVLVVLDGSRD